MGRSLSLKIKEVFHLCFWSHLHVSLSSSHQVFLNWNCSLSLQRKPSLSELSLQSKSFSTPSLSFRRKSSKSFNESFVEETKSFCAINVFLIKEISVFHNPGIIICYGNKIETTTKKLTPREKKSQATIKLNIQIV